MYSDQSESILKKAYQPSGSHQTFQEQPAMKPLGRGAKIAITIGVILLVITISIIIAFFIWIYPLIGTIKIDSLSATMNPAVGGQVVAVFKLKNTHSKSKSAQFATEMTYDSAVVSRLASTTVSLPPKEQTFTLTVNLPVTASVASSIVERCQGKKGNSRVSVFLGFDTSLVIDSTKIKKGLPENLLCAKLTVNKDEKKK